MPYQLYIVSMFHIISGVNGRCSVHLINDGITLDDTDHITIEWGLSAPDDAVLSAITFDHVFENCKYY